MVKLDSNGSHPTVLQQLIDDGLIDYVAMDVKTSIEAYPSLVGNLVQPENIEKSIGILKSGTIPYEFRSTLVKECHTPEIIEDMVTLVSGAPIVYLQQFRPGITLSPQFTTFHSFTVDELAAIKQQFEAVVQRVQIRT